MAASRKQVSTVPKRKPVYPCTWKEETFTALEIKQNQKLPIVAMVKNTTTDVEQNFDTSQPLLLYRSRVKTKVEAHGIVPNQESANAAEATERVVIPEDYAGWFMCNPTKEKKYFSKYTSIASLAQSVVEEFLIGGKIALVAFRDNQNETCDHRMAPGDVLKIDRVVSKEYKKMTYSSKFRSTKKVTEDFLACTNNLGRECLIPCNERGVFYPVLVSGKRTLFQMCDLLKERAIPCDVQLVFGREPDKHFNHNLHLLSSFEEESIVASTIFKRKNFLVELNVNLTTNFFVAANMSDLVGDSKYKDALKQCEQKSEQFLQWIRVYPYYYSNNEAIVGRTPGDSGDETAGKDCTDEGNDGTQRERSKSDTQVKSSSFDMFHTDTLVSGSADMFDERIKRSEGRSQSVDEDNRCENRCVYLIPNFELRARLSLSPTVTCSYPTLHHQTQVKSLYTSGFTVTNDEVNTPCDVSHPGDHIVGEREEYREKVRQEIHCRQDFIRKTLQSKPHNYENMTALEQEQIWKNDILAHKHDCVFPFFMNDGSDSSEEYRPNRPTGEDRSIDNDSENTYERPQGTASGRHSTTFLHHNLTRAPNVRDSGITCSTDQLSVASLTVGQVSDALRERLVDERTVDTLRSVGVDGQLLKNIDEETLRETVPGISRLDVIKINMYIDTGWGINK